MLSLFPRDVMDEIWDSIESVPENFLPTFDISLHTKGKGDILVSVRIPVVGETKLYQTFLE